MSVDYGLTNDDVKWSEAPPLVKPNGYVVLPFMDGELTVIGGPFDGWRPGSIGVCLEKHSALSDKADVMIDVPDFQAPTLKQLEDGLVAVLWAANVRVGAPVYVGCRGGIGRTGTFVAALAKVLDCPGDPVEWTRTHYLASAVETSAQVKVVSRVSKDAVMFRFDAMVEQEDQKAASELEAARPKTKIEKLQAWWDRAFSWLCENNPFP